jgi:hypothetical protein
MILLLFHKKIEFKDTINIVEIFSRNELIQKTSVNCIEILYSS